MKSVLFEIDNRELQINFGITGKEKVIYDNKVVSETKNMRLSNIHRFSFIEKKRVFKYEVIIKSRLSGVISVQIKRNGELIKKSLISVLTGRILRLFLLLTGAALVGGVLLSYHLFTSGFYESLGLSPGVLSASHIWFKISLISELFFGTIFVFFSILLRRVLTNSPGKFSAILWARIGFSALFFILALPNRTMQIWYMIQDLMWYGGGLDLQQVSSWFFQAGLIWMYWYLLKNGEAIAQELRSSGSW
ncbi:MAG: hypothetical protein WBA57_23275 [Elainellaceae cyanobacterium]